MGEAEEVGQEGVGEEGVGEEGGLWDERELGGRGPLSVLQCDEEVQEEKEVGEECVGGEGDLRAGEDEEEALVPEGGSNGLEEELGKTQAEEGPAVGGGQFLVEGDEKELVIEEGEN